MKKISYKQLEQRLPEFLSQYFDTEAAQKSAEVILYAERHHIDGQGLMKLAGSEPLQSVIPQALLEIDEKTPSSAVIKGNRQPSFYVSQVAVDLAIAKAGATGFAVIGVNGLYSSNGALRFYAEKLAQNDLVGLVMARSPGSMTPFGTKVPLFGTNPLAIGFPASGEPLVFDMATSAITWYELVVAKMRGQSIPEGLAIDGNGALTIDPAEAMKGGILPFDKSYKGSGLSMMVEMMSGPLVGASFCDFETFDKDWGFFILAFSPKLLIDLEAFKQQATELVDIVRAQDKIDGSGKARLPGDASRAFAQQVLETDVLEIDEEIAYLIGLQ